MGNELWSMDEPTISGIKEATADEDFSIYPNPSSSFITIGTRNAMPVSIRIYDINGQLLLDEKQPANNRLDVSHFTSGVYIAEVSHDFSDGSAPQRLKWVKM
jgi:hypothetical protein